TMLNLWDIWWFQGASTYVLYRGLGLILIFAIAILTVIAMNTTEISTIDRGDVSIQTIGIFLLVIPIISMSLVAIPINLTTVADTHYDNSIDVAGYTITYQEGVPNQNVPAFNISLLGSTTAVKASGVIVVNEQRGIWTEKISTGKLAFYGQQAIAVGGIGWRKIIIAQRLGWVPVGGSPVYHVWLKPPGSDWQHVFASESSTASPIIDGKNISIVAANQTFYIQVTQSNTTIGRAVIPKTNQSVTVGGITFIHKADSLIARAGQTRLIIATEESYH
ncbi:MAG: rhomboid family intramembrane serine protease, partial [Halobacteriaceae archaeon]